jgi:hypothetical protein
MLWIFAQERLPNELLEAARAHGPQWSVVIT